MSYEKCLEMAGDEDNYKGRHSYYDLKDDCEKCDQIKKDMIKFGESYLDGIMSQEEAEQKASENLEWDYDAKEMLDFIVANK